MDPLAHVHVYYEYWVSKVGQDFMDFQRLWETVMICLTSEAICKTVGSMMSQHGQNGSLKAENFSMEMMLQFNLGPMHLMGSLISDIFASENKKLYLRKESKISQIVSKDFNKSAAVATFEKNDKKKSRFPHHFRSLRNQPKYLTTN